MSPVDEAPEEDVDVVKHSSPVVPKGPRRCRQHLSGDKRRKSSGSRRSDQTPLIEEDSSRTRSRHSHYGTNDDSSSSDLDPKAEISTSVAQWTKRQWQILLVVLTATCSSSFAVCLFPPFFPRLAEEKNATATIYGFVIGTNCLTSFIVTPIIGKNLPKFGVRFSFVMGMLMGGICCTVSGFLEFFPPGLKFVGCAVFIRIVHATGNALVITSTFTYSAMEFQNSVGTIFSFTRTAMNLAQLLGPLVGGAIYQAGGFYLPFVSMGAMQAGMGLLSIFLLPEIAKCGSEVTDKRKTELSKKVGIMNVLKIPTIWFSFVTFIVATVCNGFLSINLEPRVLRRFDLSPFYIGLLFGLKDGANSISSPIWGYLCDKNRKTTVKPYVILSAILVGLSFVLLGAGTLIGLDIRQSMPLLVFALCLNGVGIGGEQVAGVVDALHEATAAGYPDDPAMHGLIAGLWSSLSGAGRFVSRVGSGILVDYIGFNPTAGIVTGLQALIATMMFVYMVFCECTLKRQAAVHWKDVTIIDDDNGLDDVVVFTESGSPSESLMGKTVSIDVPKRSKSRPMPRAARSLPPPRLAVVQEDEPRAAHHHVAHSRSSSGLVAQSLLSNFY